LMCIFLNEIAHTHFFIAHITGKHFYNVDLTNRIIAVI